MAIVTESPRIVVLGSGTPVPNPDLSRWGNSTLVTYRQSALLVDCGPLTVSRLLRMGWKTTEIEAVLLTHHHHDHTLDLPTFLFTRFDLSIGSEPRLTVAGPAGTGRFVKRLIGEETGAFWPDLLARVGHPLSLGGYQDRGGVLPRKLPDVEVRDLVDGNVLSIGPWMISAARTRHVQPFHESLAYRLECDRGSVVFSGDTAPCDELTALAKGADVLVMEAVRLERDMAEGDDHKASSHDRAYAATETGTVGAAQTAQAAGVRQVVLVHQRPYMDDPDVRAQALRDVTSVYDGTVVWGSEMTEVEWP